MAVRTVRPPLPGQGDNPPWGDELNAHILQLDTELDAIGGGASDASWFSGKHWYSLGTSITIDGSYANRLATLSGMTLHNIGVSGASLSTAANGGIWTALTANVPSGAEVITMENINDFRLNVPLGAVGDAEDQAVSYYGALRAACNWILTNRPAARVFFLTAYGDAMTAGYPNGKTTNSFGKYYWEYNEAMKRVAAIYGIPVIDVGGESGINYYTCKFFTTDMIHMNAIGGQRYADYVWSQMRILPWLGSAPTSPGSAPNVPVSGVTIVQGTSVTVAPGATTMLSSTVTPSNASNKSVLWTVNTPSIATVSNDGNVTAVAPGTATVTATTVDGGYIDTISIIVATAAATAVDVLPTTWNGSPGNTQQLTATVAPSNAANKSVTWASNATGVATVNSTGLVTAVAGGTATITCTTVSGGFTDTCVVTVSATVAATSVSVTPSISPLALGATLQLTATVSPSNATNKSVTWSTNAPGVATVDSGGLVTGVAGGTATITATTVSGNKTNTCIVTVAASEWSFTTQNSPRSGNLTGFNPSSTPTYTGVAAGTYGAIYVNAVGDNAIEFTVDTTTGSGGWIVFGSATADLSQFIGAGDANQGSLGSLGHFASGVISIVGAPTPATAAFNWVADKVYRLGRSGDTVKLVQLNGVTEVVMWTGSLSGNWSTVPTKYAAINIGLMAGNSYAKPKNCKTGTWTPP